MVIIFKNKFEERDPGDLANGGIERGSNQSSAGAQLRQDKERAAACGRLLEVDIRRFGALPIGKREILHAWISERLQASKWLK